MKLQREVKKLKVLLKKRGLKWRSERARLRRTAADLRRKATVLDRLVAGGMLSEEQIRRFTTGRRVKWTGKDVAKALGLRCCSRKAYSYAKKVLKVPLPSTSTLSRWTRQFSVRPGIMDAAMSVLEAVAKGMEPMQKLCVISFDEMALDDRYCFDASTEQVLTASKLQVSLRIL